MTMPAERTRALRMGGEYLKTLMAADNLTAELRTKIDCILQHYPSGAAIQAWATSMAQCQGRLFGPRLRPETEATLAIHEAVVSGTGIRESSSPAERIQAILNAYEFLQFELPRRIALTEERRRVLRAVLRHFPQPYEIEALAHLDARLKSTHSAQGQL